MTKGSWSSWRTYQPDDVVLSETDGGYYQALVETTGEDPISSPSSWMKVSGGSSPPQTILVADNDQSMSAQDVLQDDDELGWPVGPDETWFVRAYLRFEADNSSMDARVGWIVPVDAMIRWTSPASVPNIAALPGVILDESDTQSFGSVAGEFGANFESWVVTDGDGGRVQLRWCQDTSDAGTLTRKRDSFLEAVRLR